MRWATSASASVIVGVMASSDISSWTSESVTGQIARDEMHWVHRELFEIASYFAMQLALLRDDAQHSIPGMRLQVPLGTASGNRGRTGGVRRNRTLPRRLQSRSARFAPARARLLSGLLRAVIDGPDADVVALFALVEVATCSHVGFSALRCTLLWEEPPPAQALAVV
jgi:hypothetical protein